MKLRDVYNKGAVLRCLALSTVAFFVGASGFVGYSALVGMEDQNTVSAAWQQLTINTTNDPCNCVTKLLPTRALSGTGEEDDPYVVNNSNVDMVVSVKGAAVFRVANQYGDVLFTYDKDTIEYEEVPFVAVLSHGVGDYKVYVTMVDGIDLTEPVWIRYKAIDGGEEVPLPPATGYFYVAGFAFDMDGVLSSGSLAFFVVLIVMLAIIYLRYRFRKSEEKSARKNSPKIRIPKAIVKKN